ncbi:hypothetical protein [Congregibacter litoralis]|uniref:Uncharacterized protein n=1 Tax=Congregibacter litoralis KT71 TaxID=314285 RepID=V7HS94_9GAMM|nr:hypothetical protein [Congregibacter litoralis]ESZ89428.1 hypothetical protein KT71_002372 [Congregibacter litoralis KT71]
MKTFSKITVFAALLCSAWTNSSLADVGSGLFVLEGSGGRGWEINCDLDREDKEPMSKLLLGRGKVATMALTKVVGGTCSFKTGPREPLKITFSDSNFPEKCPFEGAAGKCSRTINPNETGTFRF